MTDVATLLQEYIEAHERGEAVDPREWLARVEGRDRLRLEVMIDRFLEQAPGRSWDAEGFRDSGMARLSEQITESLMGESGTWPAVLPSLRDRAQIKRGELVARLAAALGARGKEEKVGSYYHQMEQGLLPTDGVSDTVLEALGKILGEKAEVLRRAGSMPTPGGGGAGATPAFARSALQRDFDALADATASEPPSPASAQPGKEMDEVDRLFRAG